MELRPKPPSVKTDAHQFTGDVWYDVIVRGDPPSHIRVSRVRFSPGARTAWHRHAMGQTLHILDGKGRVQARGGARMDVRPGDTIATGTHEWHWHGAQPDHFMTHLAMWESPEQGEETEWGALVSDEEYGATE